MELNIYIKVDIYRLNIYNLVLNKQWNIDEDYLGLLWNHVVVLPAISHFEDELLPQMGDRPKTAVTVIYDAHANSETWSQTAQRSRLELFEQFLQNDNPFSTSRRYHFKNLLLLFAQY